MKLTLSLALVAIPAALLAATVACDDGSNVVPCTVDADCAGLDTDTCDTALGQCVAAPEPECADDTDCQLINPASPTTVEACDNDNDCATDGSEVCVLTEGDTVCAIPSAGPGDCGDDVEVGATKVDGGADVNVCASADGTCDDQGQCSF